MEPVRGSPLPALPAHSRSSKRGRLVAFLLLCLAVGAVGLAARTETADDPPGRAQQEENAGRVSYACRTASPAGPAAGSLQEVLAHPELIPTHHHPLLGRQAPDFELEDLDGTARSLTDLSGGEPLVLVFYHSYCNLCVRQLCEANCDLPLFRQLGARVAAVCADPPDSLRRQSQQHGPFGFPVLSDPGNLVAQAYQVFRRAPDGRMAGRLLHGTFLLDRQGKIAWVNVGDAPLRRNSVLLSWLAQVEGRPPAPSGR